MKELLFTAKHFSRASCLNQGHLQAEVSTLFSQFCRHAAVDGTYAVGRSSRDRR